MAEGVINVRTLSTYSTVFPADTVEWCPTEPYRHILACGTYELVKDDPETSPFKRGQILLLRVTRGGALEQLQQVSTTAVLDMKWMHVTDDKQSRVLLAVADSVGYLQLYELMENPSSGKMQLEFFIKLRVGDDEAVMALSLDCSHEKYAVARDGPAVNMRVLVSDSAGQVSQFTWLESGSLIKDFTCLAHKFEAWIAAYDYHDPCIFYSGGDDYKFVGFDTRVGCSRHTFENNDHTAGVTSIHSNADKPFLLATGSYDENLRLWDTRNFKQPTSKISLGGGVWRLKWDPFSHRYLLAACMHDGFKIVNHDIITSVVADYKDHEKLAYGCDWSFLTQTDVSSLDIDGDTLMTTCSYEDHTLKISVVDFWPDKYTSDNYCLDATKSSSDCTCY
ncbi:PREDICTED: diphthine methyltransferase [Vollenhovia emeryi]|uniref:diphthine methyltransferase n=1 Tax=Vollenhovia emeryi TaxID=411798 RepID=UPI0005F55EFE|nr:PREDICTED: diphthine methyltransferase [Vollenhovia emeryi]XP_011876489.1 PREDICTED: diphthine methyltransferase [Vollenhovia emeryi]XP_011876490.1 PREDICTED: diphthine methyltransferase [Vollenhovia emeryi]